MNGEDAEKLAAVVTDEWTNTATNDTVPTDAAASVSSPPVGAYWPLGSAEPVWQPAVRQRIGFVAAKAVGSCLLFCFTIDAASRQYLLCFDLTEVPSDDLRVAAGSVYEAVVRLIASPNWAETQRGVLDVSAAVTIVLPAW